MGMHPKEGSQEEKVEDVEGLELSQVSKKPAMTNLLGKQKASVTNSFFLTDVGRFILRVSGRQHNQYQHKEKSCTSSSVVCFLLMNG